MSARLNEFSIERHNSSAKKNPEKKREQKNQNQKQKPNPLRKQESNGKKKLSGNACYLHSVMKAANGSICFCSFTRIVESRCRVLSFISWCVLTAAFPILLNRSQPSSFFFFFMKERKNRHSV